MSKKWRSHKKNWFLKRTKAAEVKNHQSLHLIYSSGWVHLTFNIEIHKNVSSIFFAYQPIFSTFLNSALLSLHFPIYLYLNMDPCPAQPCGSSDNTETPFQCLSEQPELYLLQPRQRINGCLSPLQCWHKAEKYILSTPRKKKPYWDRMLDDLIIW